MENTLSQLVTVVGGTMLGLTALFALNRDGISRVTEALLDSIEIGLARRRAERADFSVVGRITRLVGNQQ